VIDTRYGPLSITSDGDDLIGRFLKECGEWAFFETSFIASVLEDGARVLDGGAFLGTFGLGIGLRRKLGLLCAAEANPQIIPLLDANLRRNANAQFEVIGSLLTGSDGPPRIGHVNPGNLGSASYSEDALSDEILPHPEAVVTLKTLRERYGSFDLIKLDIEGMEREVLLGDEEYLSRGSTTLWIECNENQRALDVLDLLLSWGVQVNYFAFPSHNPDNFLSLHKPILPWAYEAGLLVSPGRPPVLSGELSEHGCILRSVASRDALEDAMWFTPRGLPEELAVADAPALAAVASRALRGQERSRFLVAELAENVWSRLAATQEGLACAEHLAVSRLAEPGVRQRGLRLQCGSDAPPQSQQARSPGGRTAAESGSNRQAGIALSCRLVRPRVVRLLGRMEILPHLSGQGWTHARRRGDCLGTGQLNGIDRTEVGQQIAHPIGPQAGDVAEE